MPDVPHSKFSMAGTRYVGHCDDCDRAARSSRPEDKGRTCLIACPDCKVLTEGVRVSSAPSGSDKCSTACRESTDIHCTCPCGGSMHGLYWGTASHLQLITPAMLAAYRARREEGAANYTARIEKEMKDRKAVYYKWVAEDGNREVVTRLLCVQGACDFVKDMQEKVMRFYPLKPSTVAYLREVLDRRDVVEAARKARFPLVAGGQQISGTILRIRIYANGIGGFRYQMYVRTAMGNLIRCDLPCVIKDWSLAQDNFSGKKAMPRMTPEEYWTDYLEGMPVSMHTILTPQSYDPTSAMGTYPTQTDFPKNWKQEELAHA